MYWTVAPCLDEFRAEINSIFPNRDKKSDGTKGNAAHAARKSDHNPDENGIVKAYDVDEDLLGEGNPSGQDELAKIAEYLRGLGEGGDFRLNGGPGYLNGYIIYERKITGAGKGWTWRNYSGPNAHLIHMHISCCSNPSRYSLKTNWGLRDLLGRTNTSKTSEVDMLIYTVEGKGTFLFDGDGVISLDQNALSELKRAGVRDMGKTNSAFHNFCVEAAESKRNAGRI